MTLTIRIDDDLAALRRDLTRAARKAMPTATSQALNRTGASMRKVAVKAMSKHTGIPQKDIRSRITLHKATRASLTVRIEATGRPLNVIRFMDRRTVSSWLSRAPSKRRVITAKPWGIKRTYSRRVFIGNQGRTLFIREGGTRMTVRGLAGPSIGRELVRDEVRDQVMAQFRLRWPRDFEAAMNNQLRRLGWR